MKASTSARLYALGGTAVVALLAAVLVSCTYLSAKAKENKKAEILIAQAEPEEFVEVVEPPTTSPQTSHEDATAHLDEPQTNASQPTPASGIDVEDKGSPGEAQQPLAAKQESPVKVKKEEPKKPKGPSAEEIKRKQQEEVKRKANNEVANAFNNSKGKHNTSTSTTRDDGPSGKKTDNPSQQGTTGHGSGSVGGGWILPQYASVPSTVTGSVKIVAKIDKTGTVVSVSFSGGTPPAATNASLKRAIENEVRSRKFSRTNYDDAKPATAYITYTFK